jgi:hypothetical protein
MEDPTAGQAGVGSIGELVTTWIAAIDCGAWSYNRLEDHWDYDGEKLEAHVASLHLT